MGDTASVTLVRLPADLQLFVMLNAYGVNGNRAWTNANAFVGPTLTSAAVQFTFPTFTVLGGMTGIVVLVVVLVVVVPLTVVVVPLTVVVVPLMVVVVPFTVPVVVVPFRAEAIAPVPCCQLRLQHATLSCLPVAALTAGSCTTHE